MKNVGQDTEHILVYVNDKPKRLFLGLKVKHAIGPRHVRRVQARRAVVRNEDGNTVDVDGALYDGERLYIVPVDPTELADDLVRRAQDRGPKD